MANPHFNALFKDNDSQLISDLNEQVIYDRGIGIKYLKRDSVISDDVLREPVVSKFAESYDIDILVEEGQSFLIPNMGMDFSGFNLNSDFIKVTTHKMQFDSIVGSSPNEGDLIYVPEFERFFEISNIDHSDPLASGGRFYIYEMFIQLYSYSEGTQYFEPDNLQGVTTSVIDDFLHTVNPEDYIVQEFIDFSSDSITFDNVAAFSEVPYTFDSVFSGRTQFLTFDDITVTMDNQGPTFDQDDNIRLELDELELHALDLVRNDTGQNYDIEQDSPIVQETITTNPYDWF